MYVFSLCMYLVYVFSLCIYLVYVFTHVSYFRVIKRLLLLLLIVGKIFLMADLLVNKCKMVVVVVVAYILC